MDQAIKTMTSSRSASQTLERILLSDEFIRATEEHRREAVEKLLKSDPRLNYLLQDLLRKRDRFIRWYEVSEAFVDDEGSRKYLKIKPPVMHVDEIQTDAMLYLEDRLTHLNRFTSRFHNYELVIRYDQGLLRKTWMSYSSIVEMWIGNNGNYMFVYSSPDVYLVVSSLGGHAGLDLAEFSYADSHGEDMIEDDLTELNLEQLKVFIGVKARQYINDALADD